jgi:hypothetical protein
LDFVFLEKRLLDDGRAGSDPRGLVAYGSTMQRWAEYSPAQEQHQDEEHQVAGNQSRLWGGPGSPEAEDEPQKHQHPVAETNGHVSIPCF